MEETKLQSMRADDWSAVSSIDQAGMDTNLATFQVDCPSYAQWDASHILKCCLKVERAGLVVGWAALSPVSTRHVYAGIAEVSVYIDPTMQGAGIGTALLEELCRVSELEGYWTLKSGIFDNNTASLRLYETCGFRRVGYRERIGKDRYGTWRNTVIMETQCNRIALVPGIVV